MNTMTRFSGNPILEHLEDGVTCRVNSDFSYADKSGRVHVIHKDELTDGGSIPRFFWRLIGGPYVYALRAYLIHDHYCRKAHDVPYPERARLRHDADDLLLEILEYLATFPTHKKLLRGWKRWAIYRGVRLGALSGRIKKPRKH